MNTIIFSKDRACQLHLLLQTLDRCGGWGSASQPLKVLYWASYEDYHRGYDLLQEMYPAVFFISQTSAEEFIPKLRSLVRAEDYLTWFLVDDIVFTGLDRNPFNTWVQDHLTAHTDTAAVSLRLCPRINYCYTENRKAPKPLLYDTEDGLLRWEWKGQPGDWGYPMSLDGNVFRTADLLPYLEDSTIVNPNAFENAMARGPLKSPWLACFRDSALFNVPANRVQDTHPNRSMHSDPMTLNAAWLAGDEIDPSPFRGYQNRSPHEEVNYILRRRHS